ncbi:hypothetical protein J2W37_000622 [Variovorax paradoxus]|nr:hypothetical protein [Variovorax paradoxus]
MPARRSGYCRPTSWICANGHAPSLFRPYVLSCRTVWLFAAPARASEHFRIKAPAIGLMLAALVYAFFTKALSLWLPASPLEPLFFG